MEVFAVSDVTNYQWYSNNLAITGANTYFYDVPNVTTNTSGSVFKVVAFNAAGSATSVNSTIVVVTTSQFFHPILLWNVQANSLPLNNSTNFITTVGVSGSTAPLPNERTIAYNSASNQLIVVRGMTNSNLKIMVIDADRGTNGYTHLLKTNGLITAQFLSLAGIACADDGSVYASTVASDNTYRIYRWANTDPNTTPVAIFGTNTGTTASPDYNPAADLNGLQMYRYGDNLAVRGSGASTEIIVDAQNIQKYAAILTPVDGTLASWNARGYLLQNVQGSYGSEAYGLLIGRSLQFGDGNTFYQKRYNAAAGSPLAKMGYTPGGGGVAPLVVANTSPGIFTSGAVGVNTTLKMAAALNFVSGVGADSSSTADSLVLFDLTDPAQAVLLSTTPIPGGNGNNHKGNTQAIGHVLFGSNPGTGTNYIFVINANNSVSAFVLSGGVFPAPRFVAQPHNLRLLQGGTDSLSITLDQVATVKWYKGTNSPVDTGVTGASFTINNATPSSAGDYFAVATNLNGGATSSVAHVTIGDPNENYSIAPLFVKAPAGGSYVTSDGGPNTPNERSFAYYAPSNKLVVVRCPPSSTDYTLWVVDGTTGASLYTLSTVGVVHQGLSENPGSNPIDLVGAAFGDDGALYVASESPNASGGTSADTNKMLQVYRWTNIVSTTRPVSVYHGDPANQSPGINLRWGDVITARGVGTGTELFLNSFDGTYGALLRPTDATLNTFTNFFFNDSGGGGSIGRSVQFGTGNTLYEKRKGSALVYSTYDTNLLTSGAILNVDFSTTLGGVAIDNVHKLAAGVDFIGSAATPDAVALYDISDLTAPMLLGRTNFSGNQQANANVICQTIISGNRVYSLDANNGFVAFTVVPPASSMVLSITPAGANVNLSWGNPTAILQSTTSVSGAPTWTDIAGPGLTNSVQSVSGNTYYRLIQRL
jgi:hypothetical protein